MNGPIVFQNDSRQAKAMFSEMQLAPGDYRLTLVYRILDNPHRNVNLMQVQVMDAASNASLRSVVLPRKLDQGAAPGPLTCQVLFSLPSARRLKVAVQLSDMGRVAIDSTAVTKAQRPPLPEHPAILFINPDRGFSAEHIVHQGISSIAAYLRTRGVQSHALITSTSDDDTIYACVERYRYPYVGFYVNSDSSALGAVRHLTENIKRRHPEVRFMAGGPHATLSPADLMRDIPLMDICVKGEGEKPCLQILSGQEWGKVQGISYRTDGTVAENGEQPLLHANELPTPLRDNYINPDWNAHSLTTSRGCPNNCHFCIGHRIFGRTIRFRPLEHIDRELQWIYENCDHSRVVSINDDMFNMRRDRTLSLMAVFRKYPFFYFPRGMRADRLDAETTRAMREAGVVGTSIGIEQADNQALKAMQKGETLEDIDRGIKHLRDNNIGIVAQFMIGNIGDTLETVKRTIDYSLRHRFADLNMSCAIPFPGTYLEKYVKDNNLLLKEPYQVFDDVENGNVSIYFETPAFPLKDRIKAVELACEAGLLRRRSRHNARN
ncbi:MAG: B12-binding domain-containing radical SAM protein [Limisphaerales bacterium]